MFFEIADASINLGAYYGGIAFWTLMWIGIYGFYAYLICRLAWWCGGKIGEGLLMLKEKFKSEKDIQEKETEE